MKRVEEKRMRQQEAATVLGISKRQGSVCCMHIAEMGRAV
jgi:predicted XRE-type DNA-binding protein